MMWPGRKKSDFLYANPFPIETKTRACASSTGRINLFSSSIPMNAIKRPTAIKYWGNL